MGAGSGSAWSGVNGVKAIYGVHDITFDDCTFEEFSRFSIEVWSDDDPANRPYNFAVYDSVFEPAGSQCISWSGGRNPMYSIIDGCLFKGYGTNLDRAGGACLEFAGSHHIVTRNCEIWTGSGSAFNVNNVERAQLPVLQERPRLLRLGAPVPVQAPPMCTRVFFGCDGMSYSRWVKCHFDTGDAEDLRGQRRVHGREGSPVPWSLTNRTTTSARRRSRDTSAEVAYTFPARRGGTGPLETAALTRVTGFRNGCRLNPRGIVLPSGGCRDSAVPGVHIVRSRDSKAESALRDGTRHRHLRLRSATASPLTGIRCAWSSRTGAEMISIIMRTYNRASTLPRAIESVLRQGYTDWELIVVDDGSTDETADVLAAVCRRPTHQGVQPSPQPRSSCSHEHGNRSSPRGLGPRLSTLTTR